jgi:ferredoxin-NADP reductase
MTIRLRFVNRLNEADHVASFLFEPESLLDYQAGQYLQCQLPHPDADARGVSRSFTIASAPGEPFLRLTTRLSTKPSTFKQALAGLRPGGVLEASGPFGQFVYTETDTPAVMIAGGIGITPFRAMLADLADRKVRASTTLLYSNSSADIPFQPFFDGLVRDWPWLHVVYTVTQPDADWRGPTGRIDAAFIRRHVNDRTRPLYFVCGPSPLVEAMRATLAEMGVDPSRIKHEGFPGYEAAHATESGAPVAMVH